MDDATQQSEQGARKPCVACGELIPANATICSHCLQRQTAEKRSQWKMIMGWVAAASALIGLFVSLSGGFHWFVGKHTEKAELEAKMAVAQEQTQHGEYEASVKSYGEILKGSPMYAPAQDGQLSAAMLWVENFQVLGRDDKDPTDLAAAKLDEVMPVLDAGLARSKGEKAADVQAHLGWAHWLNWHVAQREYGPAAEQNLRAALELYPSDVYANAMLGNWMLQNNGNFAEAVKHLNAAVATGKARALVRTMQLGGLTNDEVHGARAELVRAANDMRKNHEPLDDDWKQRVLVFCYNPTTTEQNELVESLTAVPEDDAWKTYLWLDDRPNEDSSDKDFVYANLLEVSGKRMEALDKFRALQHGLGSDAGFTLRSRVDDAVKRLSHGTGGAEKI